MTQRAITSFKFQGIESRILRAADGFTREQGSELMPALTGLPSLMRIFSRTAFDNRLSLPVRHQAAAAAYYILLEHDSHAQTGKPDAAGLLDVLALALLATESLVEQAGDLAISEHWKGSGTLSAFLTLHAKPVYQKLPTKVRQRLEAYIGIAQPPPEQSGRIRFPFDNDSAE
jgi:hypothetical protein